jgi:hypothetical protein
MIHKFPVATAWFLYSTPDLYSSKFKNPFFQETTKLPSQIMQFSIKQKKIQNSAFLVSWNDSQNLYSNLNRQIPFTNTQASEHCSGTG